MANQVIALYASGGFTSNNSEDLDITYNSVEIAAGAAGTGVTITNVDAGANLDFAGAKLTNVAQATDQGDVVVLDANQQIPSSFIPSITITDVFSVANIAARDALTIGTGTGEVGEGDVVIVADDSAGTTGTATVQAYIYTGSGYTLLQSGGVVSVNGLTSAVIVLDSFDLTHTPANPGDWFVSSGATIGEHLDELANRVAALENASSGLRAFTENNVSAIAIRELAIITTGGNVERASLTNADATRQIVVASEAVTQAGSGDFYYENGAIIPGFSGLTPSSIYFVDAAGAITATPPPHNPGDNVYRVGVALSATELLFDPRHVVEHA